MFSSELFHAQYDTERREIVIDGKPYVFFVPASIERFIDQENPLQDFPLWAKIWPAGVVLASHLSHQSGEPGKRVLEIGSGLGLVGIVAACQGYDVTLTDYNPHALAFIHANANLNGCEQLTVQQLDWKAPELEGLFDFIVGSEIVYRDEDIELLAALFKRFLKPNGRVLLVEEIRKTLDTFYRRLDPHFKISIKKNRLRSENEDALILLIQMQLKDPS